MLYLMDTYVTEPDVNGNSRELIRLILVDNSSNVRNILWRDASLKGVPQTTKQLKERYDISAYQTDRLEHVQNHQLEPETWNDLASHCLGDDVSSISN